STCAGWSARPSEEALMRSPVLKTAAALCALMLTGAVVGVRGQSTPCGPDCLLSHYWTIDPEDYNKSGRAPFPEDSLAELAKRDDIGLASPGGGTRSATMTLGQLRGLQRLGWLDRVRYVSAISGGAWAAIPFTFSTRSIDELLGTYVAPGQLTL